MLLWQELREIASRHGNPSEPWSVMGDFNEIRNTEEREGRGEHDIKGIDQFNSVIEDLALTELPTSRGVFTWSNKSRGNSLIRSKLDKILVSEELLVKWPTASTELFNGGTSDYSAIITKLRDIQGNRRPFQIFNSWFDSTEVNELIQKAWKVWVIGYTLYRVIGKLKM